MNNLFSIRRLSVLLNKDLRQSFLVSFNTLLVFASSYAFLCIFSLFTSFQFTPDDRIPFFFLFTLLFVMMLPRLVYGNVNDKVKGIEYGMLPVSYLEKFVSMIITVGIVAPLCFVLAIFTLDNLFVLISPEDMGAVGFFWDGARYGINISSTLESLGSMFLIQIPFVLGNLYFRGHKVTKTALLLILVHIVLIAILIIFGMRYAISNPFEGSTEEQLYDMVADSNIDKWIYVIYYYVIPVVLLVLSLLKIKKLQYK